MGMKGRRRQLREQIAAASAPVTCPSCARALTPAAYQVAHDGGRCLPDSMIEGLVAKIGGVWHLRGAQP